MSPHTGSQIPGPARPGAVRSLSGASLPTPPNPPRSFLLQALPCVCGSQKQSLHGPAGSPCGILPPPASGRAGEGPPVAAAPSLRLQRTCPRRAAATAPSPGPGFQARGLSCAPKAWPELGFGVHDARETREHAGCLPGLRCTPAPRFGTSSLVSRSPASPVNRCHLHLPYVETESSRRDCTAQGPCWWVAGPRLEPK